MSPCAPGIRRIILVGAASATPILFTPPAARAQQTPAPTPEATPAAEPPLAAVHTPYIQYGVGFTTEFVVGSGALCAGAVVPTCVLGSGGGLVFPRVGWRSPGHWFIGGAYEFSKQDSSTLYLLPILQQLRGEARYYFLEGQVWTPFVEGGLGVAGYGNEWTVDTYGPSASLALGVEAQISRNTVIGATFAYRVIHFSEFVDSAGHERSAGFTQLMGLNIMLEARDPY